MRRSKVAGRILEMLRGRERYLSGAEMSKDLEISRSAIWKHIAFLRKEGYTIESKQAKGYQLKGVPSHLTTWELQADLGTYVFGKTIHTFPHVDSTNEVALRLAREGAEEGEVVVAEAQTRGRGRMGRRWESPPGVNIYLSLIIRPRITPSRIPLVTLMAAVACVQAIEEVTSILPVIKWPNDLLINGKKVGGILTEADMEMDLINFVIVGVGINVNMTRSSFPSTIKNVATSLQEELGHELSRNALIHAMLRGLEVWYTNLTTEEGETKLRNQWEALAQMKGKKVEAKFMGTIVRGKALGIDDDGALLVQEKSGTIKRIVAGDVTFKEE